MKRYVFGIIILLGFLLGVAAGSTRLYMIFFACVFFAAIVMILLDYQRSTYIIALYLILDYGIRNVIRSAVFSGVWDELLFIFVFFMWVYKWIIDWKDREYRFTPLGAPLIFFFGIGIFLLIVNSPDFHIGLEGFRAVFQQILWYFLVLQLLRTDRGALILYKILVIIGIGLGLHGIFQYIIGVEMPSNWVDTLEKGLRTRVYSIIGSPNILGSLMVLIIPMAIALVYGEKKVGKKIFYGLGSIIMLGCLIFTFSRGAWIGFVISVIVFILLVDKRLFIPAILGGIAILVFAPSVVNRMAYMLSPQYISSSLKGGRLVRWITGMEMWRDNFWFGVGLGHFGGAVAVNNDIPGTFYMDNYYLKTAVEMGLIGLFSFCILMYNVVIWSFRTIIKLEDYYYSFLVKGALAGMLGVLAHNLFENVFEVPMMVTYFWVLAGFIMFIRVKKVDVCDIG